MIRYFPCLLLLSGLSLHSVQAQTYIVHASLVDVESQTIRPDYTIVIRSDTIGEVAPSKDIRPPAGATVIDATGKWVMPGMVDAHVHFFQTGGLYTRPDAIDLRKYDPYEKEIAWYKENMEDQLRRYLSCGITTVIDDGATLELLKLRDRFAAKSYAPRILMAGPLISTAYTPTPFDIIPDPDQPFYTVNTPAEAVAMTEKQYSYRPDLIKIWYILNDSNTSKSAVDNLPLVKATIAEAHRHHYKVAVHATQKIAAQLAVEADADFLVHGIDDEVIDQPFIRLLKDRGVVVCPTLVVQSGYSNTFSLNYTPTPEDMAKGNPVQLASLQELRYLPDTAIVRRYRQLSAMKAPKEAREDSVRCANLKMMADAGVIIATGTDAGNIGTLHASSYYKELRAMQHAGLTNWKILVSSTLNGAKALGKEQEFGSIRRGKIADILLLDANPVEDLANLEKIGLIAHRGALLSPDSLILATPADIVQRQVNAYNAHDLEAFLRFYADTATLYELSGSLLARGHDEMRKMYAFLQHAPGLHVTIADRITIDNKVIDHELVMSEGRKLGEGLAIYFVDDRKISKVYFIEEKAPQKEEHEAQKRTYDTIPYAMEHHNARLALFREQPMTKGGIIFIGNSITEGCDWKKLLNNPTIINRGIAGDITFGVLKRLDEVIARQPAQLYIEIGINDLSKGIPDNVITDNILTIVQRVKTGSPQTRIFVQSILPTNNTIKTEYAEAMNKDHHIITINAALMEHAEKTGYTFIDLFTPFRDKEGRLDAKYTVDGLHPNAAGYRRWAEVLNLHAHPAGRR